MASIVGKLQTPADDNGVRKDIHLITEANAVIVDDDNTLGDWIQEHHNGGVEISSAQPSKPCIWRKPVE
jgi:hypothetical protein